MSRLARCSKFCAVLSAVVALGLGLASTAGADTIQFNPTGGMSPGGSNPGTSAIGSLQWNAGDAVAVASISNGSILSVGSTFQLYFQLVLSGLNDSNGSPLGTSAITGLNTNYQITEVASLTERVDTLGAGNATATFSLAPVQNANSGLKIFYEDLTAANGSPSKASFIDGTGFVPGGTGGAALNRLILTIGVGAGAGFTSLPNSNYTDNTKQNPGANPVTDLNKTGPPPVGDFLTTKTDVGGGSTGLNMNVLTYDPNFFRTANISLSAFANIGTQTPFVQVPPSTAFNDPSIGGATGFTLAQAPTIIPNPGATNGTGTAGSGSKFDFLLQLNGTPQSFAVPEPASIGMALTALTAVPLATWQMRRRRTRS